ncbi:MAG TPA: universal stress protein [Xanthobacteraceae bacterium]|jgi:nucleotide-binding universal stress UspA family protein
MLKDVIVGLGPESAVDPAANFAISLAKDFNLQMFGAGFAFVPVYPATTPMEALGADFISAQRAQNKKAANAAIARFQRVANEIGVTAQSRILEAPVADASRQFAELARHFDVAILGQAKPDFWETDLIIEAALFESGRPLIVVPYIYSGPMKLNHITVCWDGGRPAARAVGDAMPFLLRAKKVDLVTIATGATEELSSAEMEGHLARHGVNSASRRLMTDRGEEANAILNHAADTMTDLIVMGGYGHTRLREFILGGVTLGILRSMTAPVLLSH